MIYGWLVLAFLQSVFLSDFERYSVMIQAGAPQKGDDSHEKRVVLPYFHAVFSNIKTVAKDFGMGVLF